MKKFIKTTGIVLGRIIHIKLTIIVFVLVPLIAITLITSNTDILSGMKSFVVVSGSMEPTIPTGSVIYTTPKTFYSEGDVIAFERGGKTVTHRIIGLEAEGNDIFYRTKGDANNTADQEMVNRQDVVGVNLFTAPYVGKIVMSFKTPTGFLLGIVLPALIFIGMELWNIKKEIEKQTEKKVMERLELAGS